MLAKWRITRLKGLWIVNIKLIDPGGEFFYWHVDKETARLLFELLKAKGIHDNFRRFLHFLQLN